MGRTELFYKRKAMRRHSSENRNFTLNLLGLGEGAMVGGHLFPQRDLASPRPVQYSIPTEQVELLVGRPTA